jgi:predicted amidohydrolase
MTERTLRLGIFQFGPALLDVRENAQRIATAAGGTTVDLLATPELSLTGYDVRDAAVDVAVTLDPATATAVLPDGPTPLLVGLVEKAGDGRIFNTAAILQGRTPVFRHRKIYLPTYGMFDEARYFARGTQVRTHDLGAWRIGVLVCEDFWHPALSYLLAAAGVHLLVVAAAAPGRGVLQGSGSGGRFASADAWEHIASTTALLHGIYVALVNRTGVEAGLTFAGGSLVVSPGGDVLERAGDEGDALLLAELSLDTVERARRPYAHLRDEDLALVKRELNRLTE